MRHLTKLRVRTVAFYLPQFHPIAQNDAWWGKGFTEWTNVSKSRPCFRGHYQPHLPADLGFYDLRLAESRYAQAELAKVYGVHGFCYYHYWFHGQRLLEGPFNEVLTSGEPDFPFCLCWANESWSRRWLGEERDVLMPQKYSDEDDREHANWLAHAFADPRYIRASDRPIFLIYRPKDHPEPHRFVDRLCDAAHRLSLPQPFLVGVDAHAPGFDFRTIGFDSTLAFEPQLAASGEGVFSESGSWQKLKRNIRLGSWNPKLQLFDETEARQRMQQIRRPENHIPSVFVSWDNSARRGKNGIIYVNGGPENFGKALREKISFAKSLPESQRFVFINAWNEWAEGNHLEPDQKFGHAYLEQVAAALKEHA
jgi:lipopolysaccharide biosynthesis protein